MVDSRKRSSSVGLVCKLDMERHMTMWIGNFSFIWWEKFLLSNIENMGFGPKWRRWILFYISIERMSILVNVITIDFFQTSRGLRWGDPLSHYLFLMVTEAFSCQISKAEQGGFIIGFKVEGREGGGMHISHFLFANDTLLFCEANLDQLR